MNKTLQSFLNACLGSVNDIILIDNTGANAQTLDRCIDSCAALNSGGNVTCLAVTWYPDGNQCSRYRGVTDVDLSRPDNYTFVLGMLTAFEVEES